VNTIVCFIAHHAPIPSNIISFFSLVVFSIHFLARDFVSSSKNFFLRGQWSVKSSVANIVLVFTVALVVLNVAAVAIGALLDIQIGPRYDSMLRLTAICVAMELFMSREKRTLEKWEFHAAALGSALIGFVLPVTLLLAVDAGELTRPISEAYKKGGLSVVFGLSAFLIGFQYFLIYWAARFWAWNHFRTIAKAKANRR
jgi:hypothetical protein